MGFLLNKCFLLHYLRQKTYIKYLIKLDLGNLVLKNPQTIYFSYIPFHPSYGFANLNPQTYSFHILSSIRSLLNFNSLQTFQKLPCIRFQIPQHAEYIQKSLEGNQRFKSSHSSITPSEPRIPSFYAIVAQSIYLAIMQNQFLFKMGNNMLYLGFSPSECFAYCF